MNGFSISGDNALMDDGTLIVAMEALLVFGGAVAFSIWQLRSIKKDQAKARAEKEVQAARAQDASAKQSSQQERP